ncbi:nucleotide exchange factor GrpE [Pacificimonas sp. WHA3]|uniref:Protein GrpE n=1 Tax=Pacificimonas pallii TaxID=2827236 RepID=A0ABS6SBY2_9SPHN|nr:nucleotide exchange factor GrpE [Pacificimonas pallii]MBV7255421.1 nucleotide exchange factor GrpE [Pacificimonas pallii]
MNDEQKSAEEQAAADFAAEQAADDAAAERAAQAPRSADEDFGLADDGEDDPRIEQLMTEIAELKDRLHRQIAETENVRKRGERERGDSANYAITGFSRDLLSVADNLARALEAARKDEVVNEGLLTGVKMTEKELMKTFEKHGIARVASVGEKLDPNLHQAMMEVEATEETPSGTIVLELQPGYTIKDRLLRPAMVSVAK